MTRVLQRIFETWKSSTRHHSVHVWWSTFSCLRLCKEAEVLILVHGEPTWSSSTSTSFTRSYNIVCHLAADVIILYILKLNMVWLQCGQQLGTDICWREFLSLKLRHLTMLCGCSRMMPHHILYEWVWRSYLKCFHNVYSYGLVIWTGCQDLISQPPAVFCGIIWRVAYSGYSPQLWLIIKSYLYILIGRL